MERMANLNVRQGKGAILKVKQKKKVFIIILFSIIFYFGPIINIRNAYIYTKYMINREKPRRGRDNQSITPS